MKIPDQVKCVKVRFDKNFTRLEAKIRNLLGVPLESQNLWFPGLSFGTFFFTPKMSQLVACSHGGCIALSGLLHMIIFIARG